MITPAYVAKSYQRNVEIIKQQTKGLSNQQSLLQLPFRANCMNWLVGHVLANRYNVLKLLGNERTAEAERVKRYRTESQPIDGPGEGVLSLDELLAALDQAQAQISARLAEITPSELAPQVDFFGGGSRSVGEWLVFFYFHDSYHTGQTEIMRQAAGTDDKII